MCVGVGCSTTLTKVVLPLHNAHRTTDHSHLVSHYTTSPLFFRLRGSINAHTVFQLAAQPPLRTLPVRACHAVLTSHVQRVGGKHCDVTIMLGSAGHILWWTVTVNSKFDAGISSVGRLSIALAGRM